MKLKSFTIECTCYSLKKLVLGVHKTHSITLLELERQITSSLYKGKWFVIYQNTRFYASPDERQGMDACHREHKGQSVSPTLGLLPIQEHLTVLPS